MIAAILKSTLMAEMCGWSDDAMMTSSSWPMTYTKEKDRWFRYACTKGKRLMPYHSTFPFYRANHQCYPINCAFSTTYVTGVNVNFKTTLRCSAEMPELDLLTLEDFGFKLFLPELSGAIRLPFIVFWAPMSRVSMNSSQRHLVDQVMCTIIQTSKKIFQTLLPTGSSVLVVNQQLGNIRPDR